MSKEDVLKFYDRYDTSLKEVAITRARIEFDDMDIDYKKLYDLWKAEYMKGNRTVKFEPVRPYNGGRENEQEKLKAMTFEEKVQIVACRSRKYSHEDYMVIINLARKGLSREEMSKESGFRKAKFNNLIAVLKNNKIWEDIK